MNTDMNPICIYIHHRLHYLALNDYSLFLKYSDTYVSTINWLIIHSYK